MSATAKRTVSRPDNKKHSTSTKPGKSAKKTLAKVSSQKEIATIDPEHRQLMIANSAYYKAEKRGFQPGHELKDWLEAEQEISEYSSKPK